MCQYLYAYLSTEESRAVEGVPIPRLELGASKGLRIRVNETQKKDQAGVTKPLTRSSQGTERNGSEAPASGNDIDEAEDAAEIFVFQRKPRAYDEEVVRKVRPESPYDEEVVRKVRPESPYDAVVVRKVRP